MDEIAERLVSNEFLADLRRVAPQLRHVSHGSTAGADLAPEALRALGAKLEAARCLAASRARDALDRYVRQVPDSPLLGKISLFKSIGQCRQETVHTNALAWLLDARQPHEFGNALYLAFLRAAKDCGTQQDDWQLLADSELGPYRVIAEFSLSASCRIDLFLEGALPDGRPWVMLIEAKVGAQERLGQLSDYETALRSQMGSSAADTLVLRVFLSEQGRPARTAAGSKWAALSFKDLAREFMHSYPLLRDAAGHQFLRLYLTGVLADTCGVTCSDDLETLVTHNNWSDLVHLLEREND